MQSVSRPPFGSHLGFQHQPFGNGQRALTWHALRSLRRKYNTATCHFHFEEYRLSPWSPCVNPLPSDSLSPLFLYTPQRFPRRPGILVALEHSGNENIVFSSVLSVRNTSKSSLSDFLATASSFLFSFFLLPVLLYTLSL